MNDMSHRADSRRRTGMYISAEVPLLLKLNLVHGGVPSPASHGPQFAEPCAENGARGACPASPVRGPQAGRSTKVSGSPL